jgi:hypothetical protein
MTFFQSEHNTDAEIEEIEYPCVPPHMLSYDRVNTTDANAINNRGNPKVFPNAASKSEGTSRNRHDLKVFSPSLGEIGRFPADRHTCCVFGPETYWRTEEEVSSMATRPRSGTARHFSSMVGSCLVSGVMVTLSSEVVGSRYLAGNKIGFFGLLPGT